MNVLLWHVHGSWTTGFVQGPHRYLVPVVSDRGPDGRGRARTFHWPDTVVEVSPDELADTPVDVVVLQRPRDEELARQWLGGRLPGSDVPAVWLEHNAPQGAINELRHPAADRDDVVVVHVTHTNALFWDTGSTRTRVIEHGVVDPGYRYDGGLPRAAVVVNEPVRRARVAGTDLLPAMAVAAPLDVFGMGVDGLVGSAGPVEGLHGRIATYEDLPQSRLHRELPLRRLYLHPYRWTSLGLSLIEAMLLGMPIVALATTETPLAVPPAAGAVDNDLVRLREAMLAFLRDPEHAHACGLAARRAALDRYGIERFLNDWDNLLEEIA